MYVGNGGYYGAIIEIIVRLSLKFQDPQYFIIIEINKFSILNSISFI